MSQSLTIIAVLLSVPGDALRRGSRRAGSGGIVFTLGDSYSSGVGIHPLIQQYDLCPKNPSELRGWCCRDYESIAGALYAKEKNLRSVNKACGGSQIRDIVTQFDNDILKNPEFAAEVANQFEDDVIHLTIGGNNWKSKGDVEWGELLLRCMVEWRCNKKDENQWGNMDSIGQQLDSFYDTLATHASKAHIRIMGYPRLFTWRFPCLVVPGISREEADWADSTEDLLNSRINQSVATTRGNHPNVDIRFVPVTDYLTKGACHVFHPHVTHIKLAPTVVSPMSFHPSRGGYEEYFHALSDSLK